MKLLSSRFRFCLLITGLAIGLPAISSAQTLKLVLPSQTDSAITQFNNFHFVFLNTNVPPLQKLMVFLPGTGGTPSGYTNVTRSAANFGFHALGLTYVNPTTLNSLCGDSTNPNCYAEARLAIINGGTNAEVSISQTDSITNRLTKLIIYLATNYPAQNWGQYLDATGNINWPQVVIAGHSQGAGHSGIIAKVYPVSRSVMFSDTDWWTPNGKLPGQPADWIIDSGITLPHSYFGFVHTNDPLIPYGEEIPTWIDYGLATFGGPTIVEAAVFPFVGSHMLTTGLMPDNFDGSGAYHGATVSDRYTPLDTNGVAVYLGVWQYMMTAPAEIPQLQLALATNNLVQLSFGTVTNCSYQLQTAESPVGPWTNNGIALIGTGNTNTVLLSRPASLLFYRLAVGY